MFSKILDYFLRLIWIIILFILKMIWKGITSIFMMFIKELVRMSAFVFVFMLLSTYVFNANAFRDGVSFFLSFL